MKKRLLKKFFTLLLLISLFNVGLVVAQAALSETPGSDTYGLDPAGQQAGATKVTAGSIAGLLGRFAGAGLAIAGSAFLFLVVYGGILILTSTGDSTKVEKGKKAIIWAVIGAIVIGSALAITQLVFQALT